MSEQDNRVEEGIDMVLLRRKKIGEFFRQNRISAGLKVPEIAGVLGLPDTTVIIEFESGEKALPLEKIFALVNALNIDPQDFLAFIDSLFLNRDA